VKHIKRIYSHTKALDQCVSFTSYYLENAETIETSSTSKAAEIVAEDSTGELAAICSTLTAERYKLTILARSIEDQEDNMTRFFILQKNRNNEPAISLSRFIPPPQAVEESKSIVWFRIAHETPGTLQRVLGCFSRQGINLTHIHSLPTLTHAFQYIFFVEFRELGPGASQGTRLALEQLGSLVQHWRYLGTWVDRSGAVV
jgi:prephenate dehydratase